MSESREAGCCSAHRTYTAAPVALATGTRIRTSAKFAKGTFGSPDVTPFEPWDWRAPLR